MNKYELTDMRIEVGDHTLYRIRALRDFTDVREGELGGYVESENNLSHEEDCWVYGGARIYEYAHVRGNARAYRNAHIRGNTQVYGGNWVSDDGNLKCENIQPCHTPNISDLKAGDVVTLNSSGPKMTIASKTDTQCTCIWFLNGIPMSQSFDVACLKKSTE